MEGAPSCSAFFASPFVASICFDDWLIQAEFDESLAWAKRHSVQSWRERYRKKVARFDPVIARYAVENPPETIALYGRSRRYNKKNLGKGLIVMESEEGSDKELEAAVQLPSQTLEKSTKTLQRQRAESNGESSSGTVAKRRKIDVDISDQDHRGSFAFSPVLQPLEPALPQSQQLIRNPIAGHQPDIDLISPVPSPTLVQRTTQAVQSSHSTRHVTGAADSSLRLSTSFRNVAQSSPALNDIGPPSTSRIIRSHHTSVTEPSSRSLLVPTQLSHSPGNTTNAPAEPSIIRESSHKPSSPKSQPLSTMNASRKMPSSQPSGYFSSSDEEDEQGTQWAPYKNTRSRSRSIEPVYLPVLQGKRKGRIARRNRVVRNETLLEPVHESEVEQKQEDQSLVNMTVTETMREEQKVADLLMLNLGASASGTRLRASIGQTRGDDGNDSQSDDVKRTYRLEKSRREEDIPLSGKVQNIGNTETVLPSATESLKFKLEDKEDDFLNVSESEGVRSSGEDSELVMSSDDQATEQQFLPKSGLRYPPRSSFYNHDGLYQERIPRPKDLLDSFDSPAGRRFQKQRPQTHDFQLGSPTPLRSQNQGHPRQLLTVRRSSQAADVHTRPPGMLVETSRTGNKNPSDGSKKGGLSSTSTFIKTRPLTSHVNIPSPTSSFRRHSSIQHSILVSRRSQEASESSIHSRRHASEESTSSELQT